MSNNNSVTLLQCNIPTVTNLHLPKVDQLVRTSTSQVTRRLPKQLSMLGTLKSMSVVHSQVAKLEPKVQPAISPPSSGKVSLISHAQEVLPEVQQDLLLADTETVQDQAFQETLLTWVDITKLTL
jgi:hypothetical protein